VYPPSQWVSLAEIKAKADEENRMREAAGSDDTAERALNQMMGGSLAGQSAQVCVRVCVCACVCVMGGSLAGQSVRCVCFESRSRCV